MGRAFGAEDELELVDAFVAVQVELTEDGASELLRGHGHDRVGLTSHGQDRLRQTGARPQLHTVLVTPTTFYNVSLTTIKWWNVVHFC